MKTLFDQGTPAPLRSYLHGHEVVTAYEMGWSELSNGDLLQAAQQEAFQMLVTTDQNLRYQQDLSTRKIAVAVLDTTSWPRIQRNIDIVVLAINAVVPNDYFEIYVPE